MRYEELQQLIETAQPIKILRAKNAPLLISFLFAEFKARNRITIPSYELTSHLADFIDSLKDNSLFLQEKGNSLSIAHRYIDQWCSEESRYLTRFPDEIGEPMHELPPSVERVFQWLQSLQKREFVGTESRFKR